MNGDEWIEQMIGLVCWCKSYADSLRCRVKWKSLSDLSAAVSFFVGGRDRW